MRLLVRYSIAKYNEHGLCGVDLPNFDYMTALDIQGAIEAGICDQYNNVGCNEIKIEAIEYIGAKQENPVPVVPSPILNMSKKCLVCGGEHGGGGLPCPQMTPMAKLL